MFLTDRKLEARLHEIEKFRYRDVTSFEYLECMEDTSGEVSPLIPKLDYTK